LPDTYDGLCLKKLNNPEFEIQETENDNQSVSDDDHKLSSNAEMQEIKNNLEVSNNERQAMLTQMTMIVIMSNILFILCMKKKHVKLLLPCIKC